MKPWLALPLALVLAAHSWARPYYAPAGEMVRGSEIIAVVDVQRVRAVDERGGTWRYAQAADGAVLRTYKGRLPARIASACDENAAVQTAVTAASIRSGSGGVGATRTRACWPTNSSEPRTSRSPITIPGQASHPSNADDCSIARAVSTVHAPVSR